MELVSWKPFSSEPSSLRQEMDRLWNRFVGESPLARRIFGEWWPTVDVSEAKDNFMIKAELPGMDEKDMSVTISGNVFTIKGEKKKEEEEKDKHHYRAERYYGSFQR